VTTARKVVAVAVPWVFLVVFAVVYALLALPRVMQGDAAAICIGAFIALVFVVFFVAAITFSRDILTNRWP